jgi:hypothetical protein
MWFEFLATSSSAVFSGNAHLGWRHPHRMGANKEALEAAREAVRLARKASVRPWWVTRALRRLARAPRAVCRFIVGTLEAMVDGFVEVLVVVVPLGLLLAAGLLIGWGWDVFFSAP